MKEPPGLNHAGPGRIAAARFIDSRTSPWPRRLALAAIGIACTLSALHGLLTLSYTVRSAVPTEVHPWFDMRYDYGLPSWYGFACMLAAGISCFGWGRAIKSTPITLTGVFFALLMVDDLCMLHERITAIFWEALQSTGVYSWVIVLGLPFAVAGVAAYRACRRHLGNDHTARLRLFAGFACLGVAVALEALERRTNDCGITVRGFSLVLYSQWVEESLELIGPLLIAWTAAEAWQRTKSEPAIAMS